jgi:hypothetical protein
MSEQLKAKIKPDIDAGIVSLCKHPGESGQNYALCSYLLNNEIKNSDDIYGLFTIVATFNTKHEAEQARDKYFKETKCNQLTILKTLYPKVLKTDIVPNKVCFDENNEIKDIIYNKHKRDLLEWEKKCKKLDDKDFYYQQVTDQSSNFYLFDKICQYYQATNRIIDFKQVLENLKKIEERSEILNQEIKEQLDTKPDLKDQLYNNFDEFSKQITEYCFYGDKEGTFCDNLCLFTKTVCDKWK